MSGRKAARDLAHEVDALLGQVEKLIAFELLTEQQEMSLAPAFEAIGRQVEERWLSDVPAGAVAELLTLSPMPAGEPARRAGRARGSEGQPWSQLRASIHAALLGGKHGRAPASFAMLREWFAAPAVSVDDARLLGAVFEAHRALWGAMGPHPAVQVLVLSRTLAKWCMAIHPITDPRWSEQAGFGYRRAGFLRAVLAYGTAMLARAARNLTGGGQAVRRDASVYREAHAARSQGPAADPLLALRDVGIDRMLEGALAHATVAAALAAVEAPAMVTKWNWHYAALRRIGEQANDACARLAPNPLASTAVTGGVVMWSHAQQLQIWSNETVAGREAARHAILVARASLGGLLGLQGELEDLAHAVGTALRTGVLPRPLGEAALVRALAERLARGPFLSLYTQLQVAAAQHRAGLRVGRQAAREISLLDRLNILTDSEAETRSKHADATVKKSRRVETQARQRVHDLLIAELAAHPGPNAYYALSGPLAHLEAVRVEIRWTPVRGVLGARRHRVRTPILVGRDELVASIDRWMRHAVANVGRAPSTGELLQGYGVALLQREGWS